MCTKKTKILLVDDDIDIRNQMELWLSEAGYEVISAGTQSEAEKIMEKIAFDAAVLDLMLEYKDSGFVLAYKIKKQNPNTPVFIVTAANKETGLNFSVNDGFERTWIKADAVLNKGIRPEQLAGLIKTALERK